MNALSSGLILATSESEAFPQDDIDRLFNKLHQLQPPEDIVKQILARVKSLPAPVPQPNTRQEAIEETHEAAE